LQTSGERDNSRRGQGVWPRRKGAIAKCRRRSESPSGSRIALRCTVASGIFRRGDPHLRAPRRKTPTVTESGAAADAFGNAASAAQRRWHLASTERFESTEVARDGVVKKPRTTAWHRISSSNAWHDEREGALHNVLANRFGGDLQGSTVLLRD
jgi:hypothetical protein